MEMEPTETDAADYSILGIGLGIGKRNLTQSILWGMGSTVDRWNCFPSINDMERRA